MDVLHEQDIPIGFEIGEQGCHVAGDFKFPGVGFLKRPANFTGKGGREEGLSHVIGAAKQDMAGCCSSGRVELPKSLQPRYGFVLTDDFVVSQGSILIPLWIAAFRVSLT